MSRAFVDEDAGQDETEDMHEIPLPLAPGARNYMTPEGALLMNDELRRLDEVERPRASAALAAAEPADKADYLRRLSEIDRRVSYLGRMKSILEVVEPPAATDRVVFGLKARVREASGAETEYRIVGVDESDPEHGLVSWASPVARALLGRHVGDTAVVKLPQGEKRLTILEIK
ncbi:MAG: GreA/GreB family elongation factor [Spirochaetes bacterium]|nr:GreA/GreB family elongation factor [Spirochaetota bacterium]